MNDGSDILRLPDWPEIDNLEVLEPIARGGISVVFKARHKLTERIVALKVLSRQIAARENWAQRFEQEARLTAKLNHPAIVKTLGYGFTGEGDPYLVLEYLNGRTLAKELAESGRLSLLKFRDLFLPVLEALELAHESGLVHRDIKPGNIMLYKSDDGTDKVKLLDFGIAKSIEAEAGSDRLTGSGLLLGSPVYMSPEQCAARAVDRRSDIYSASCVMYEALIGEPPFSGESALEVMSKHVDAPAPTVSDMSRKIDIRKELAALVVWGLAKDPSARPQTALDLKRQLNLVLEKITLDRVLRPKSELPAGRLRQLSTMLATLAFALSAIVLLFLGLNKHYSSELKRSKADLTQGLPDSTRHDRAEKQKREKQEKDLLETLARYVKSSGTGSQLVSDQLYTIAFFYLDQEKLPQAEEYFKRWLKQPGKDALSAELSSVLFSLGRIYGMQNRPEEALYFQRKALSMALKIDSLGPNRMLDYYAEVGKDLMQLRKFKEAEPFFDRALALAAKWQKPGFFFFKLPENNDRSHLLLIRLNAAENYLGLGKYSRAENLYKEIQSLSRDFATHSANFCFGFAECYRHQGKNKEAEPLFKQAMALSEANPALGKSFLLILLACARDNYRAEGKLAEAEALSKKLQETKDIDSARTGESGRTP